MSYELMARVVFESSLPRHLRFVALALANFGTRDGRHLGMFKDKVDVTGGVSLLEVCRRIEAEEDAAK